MDRPGSQKQARADRPRRRTQARGQDASRKKMSSLYYFQAVNHILGMQESSGRGHDEQGKQAPVTLHILDEWKTYARSIELDCLKSVVVSQLYLIKRRERRLQTLTQGNKASNSFAGDERTRNRLAVLTGKKKKGAPRRQRVPLESNGGRFQCRFRSSDSGLRQVINNRERKRRLQPP